MMIAIMVVVMLLAYLAPGPIVARQIYARDLREHRLNPPPVKEIISKPRPPRPMIKLTETLHTSNRCELIGNGITQKKSSVCTCSARTEYYALKKQWYDYDNWKPEPRQDSREPEPVPSDYIRVIPFWFVYAIANYIGTAAKGIPDPAALDRMQAELVDIDKKLKELQ